MFRWLFAIVLVFIVNESAFTAVCPTLVFELPAGTISLPGQAPLFDLYTTLDTKDRRARRLTDKDFRNVVESAVAGVRTVTFSGPPDEWGGDVKVTVTFEPTSKEVLLRISVENYSYFPIRLVRFPVLDTPPVNRFDTLLFPHNAGDAIHDPRVMISTRLSGIYSRRYPADLAMQYITLYNEARNCYMAAYNDGDEFYDHTVRTAGDCLRLSFDWYPFLDDGGKWESPVCSISMLPGDWHSAADLYREHMSKKFRAPEVPKWMRESFHGWIQIALKSGNNPPAFRYSEIPDLYRKYVEANGLNTLHLFSLFKGGADVFFPDCNIATNCGTKEDLAAAMDAVKAMGGHVDVYTNGRSVDIDSDFVMLRGGAKSWVMHEDGGPQIDGWAVSPGRQVCPFSKLYQDEQLRWYKVIVEEYRAHGTQIDQVSCTPSLFCFDKSHGHRTPAANFPVGMDTLLKRLREYYRSKNPDFFVWAEGQHERYGRYYDVNQSHGEHQSWTAGESMPEQFHYTYPDYLCTGSSDSIDAMCHTFGQGKPFDIHLRHVFKPEFADLLRKLVAVRKAEPEYFLRGRFMDTVGLSVAGRDVRYWRIDRRDGGGMLVNFWGRGRSLTDSCEASIRVPDGMQSVRAVYPSDLKIEASGDWRTLKWTGPVATIVFEPEEKK